MLDSARICIVSGAFGAGKSEVAMNLAIQWARNAGSALLVDLDIVNPFFRSRESRHRLSELGVEVISSREGLEMADLPALSPAISGAIEGSKPTVIDVGGDKAGATALGRFAPVLSNRPYDFLLVTNFNRPFSTTAESTASLGRDIEVASGLQLTGLVSNTHMMSDTTQEDVEKGMKLAGRVRDLLGLPIVMVAVSEEAFAQGVGPSDDWQGRLMVLQRYNDPNRVCL